MAKYSTPRIRPVRGGVRMRDLQKKAAYLYYYSGGGVLPSDPYKYAGLMFDINPTLDLAELDDQAPIESYTEGAKGIILTPQNSGRRPIKQANALGNYSSIKCVAQRNLIGVKSDWDWMHQQPLTLFCVLKTTGTDKQYILTTNSSSVSNIGIFIGVENTSRFNVFTSKGVSVSSMTSVSNNVLLPDMFHLVVVRLSVNGGLSRKLLIDNLLIRELDAPTVEPSDDTSFENPTLFASSNLGATTQYFTGELVRMFGYNELRSDEEIEAISGGISGKYFQ